MRTYPSTLAAAAFLAATALLPSTTPQAQAAPTTHTTPTTASGAQTASGAHTAPGIQPAARTRTAPAPAGAPGTRGAAPPPLTLGTCERGQLCLWAKPGFQSTRRVHELSTTDVDSCVPLPPGKTAQALANRTGRPVTTYQSAECAETGEFQTYPGDGVWLPESPYQIRAFKVWEN
ncbi:peptidase inhibitor family I36 protein [Streptomyces sp. NPDC101118]|uniref:peptidase inhibitor family I36 protein n=1 Tax=Streptomyces sp. NPDC101118 TaxID=3366109 RepID=UPI00380A717B